jgi:hypothetical protein
MIRTNVWKQRMLEKLGKVEATGESPQITHQVEVYQWVGLNAHLRPAADGGNEREPQEVHQQAG